MSRRGFTLVETLIAVALSSAILVATAAATHAAIRAHAINTATIDRTQHARAALHRVLTEIRQSSAQQPVSAASVEMFARGGEVTDRGLVIVRADGTELTIDYDPANLRLDMIRGGVRTTLLTQVTAFEVGLRPTWTFDIDRRRQRTAVLQRATVRLVVRAGDLLGDLGAAERIETITLSGSVTPRARAW
jgi:prepilin-type N-terminal cleavage/methylation domain-containing protein